METKLVEAYFTQKETFYKSFEVPAHFTDSEIHDYVLLNEGVFWQENPNECHDVSTELDEITSDYFGDEAARLRESGDYIAWEDEENVED